LFISFEPPAASSGVCDLRSRWTVEWLGCRQLRLARREQDAIPSAGDQRADVGDRDRPFPRVLIRHIARHPFRVELLLVEPQPLEVVPLLAALEEQAREPFARMRAALLA